ncbi:MAG: hypothetical protein WC457_00700 [Patescibacteria group bacterium]
MIQNRIDELKDLLNEIVIFAPNFKRDIFQDALELELPRLDKLIATLKKILIYQKNEIEKKMLANPHYLTALHKNVSEKRRAAIESSVQNAVKKDRLKINELINKIKNI